MSDFYSMTVTWRDHDHEGDAERAFVQPLIEALKGGYRLPHDSITFVPGTPWTNSVLIFGQNYGLCKVSAQALLDFPWPEPGDVSVYSECESGHFKALNQGADNERKGLGELAGLERALEDSC